MNVIKILGHPLIQVFSFCVILVGSPYFGGPYIFFIYHALLEGYAFAIIGATGIVVTLVSLALKMGTSVQAIGAILMVISLGIFLFGSHNMMTASAFHEVLPLMTLLLFIAVISSVAYRFFTLQKE